MFNRQFDSSRTEVLVSSEGPFEKTRTVQKGFVSVKDQIRRLVLAGFAHDMIQTGLYEFPDGKVPDEWYDPRRAPGFDITDAQAVLDRLLANQRSRAALQAAESGVESSADVVDAPVGEIVEAPSE